MNVTVRHKNRYISGFDGLRTFGVLGVILYHLNPNLFIGAYLGVPIFLAVSGYLVTDHMLASYERTGSYDNKGFYLRRLKKIYPQLLTVLLASSAYIVLFQRELLAKLYQIVAMNILNVYNWWQIFNGQSYFERFASNESPFTHLWTLSIEGQFYILWPLVIFLLVKYLKSSGKIFAFLATLSVLSALLMAFLYQPGVDTSRIYYGTDTRLYSILFGALLAVVWPSAKLPNHLIKSDRYILNGVGIVAIIGMAFLAFSPVMDPQKAFTYRGGMFLFSLLTMLLIAVVAHPGASLNRVFTNQVFKWFGQRSYGIYLYQFPVMIFFENKVKNIADNPLLYQAIEVALILIISDITYRFVERPMGKMTWAKTKAYFMNVFNFKNKQWVKKAGFGFAALITVVGLVGIAMSPSVKAKDANDSALARQINKNKADDAARNKKLIEEAKAKKKKAVKKETKSEIMKQAEADAKSKPVNSDFVQYGISQVDLQLAQRMSITAVGDSVMAGSSNNLNLLFPNMIVDATVSRQLINSFGIFESYKNQGALNDTVLVALGTNGPFQPADLDHVMQIAGPDRNVFWINTRVPTRQWQNTVNQLLTEGAKRFKNLHIIDWFNYSNSHPDWFYGDETHPNPTGSKYYTAFIAKQVIENTKF